MHFLNSGAYHHHVIFWRWRTYSDRHTMLKRKYSDLFLDIVRKSCTKIHFGSTWRWLHTVLMMITHQKYLLDRGWPTRRMCVSFIAFSSFRFDLSRRGTRNDIVHRSVKWRARSSSRFDVWRSRRKNTAVDHRVVGCGFPTATQCEDRHLKGRERLHSLHWIQIEEKWKWMGSITLHRRGHREWCDVHMDDDLSVYRYH